MRGAWSTIAALAVAVALVACRDKNDSIAAERDEPSKKTPKSASPSPPPAQVPGLVVTMTPTPHLELDGVALSVRMKKGPLFAAMGEPSWSKDYGADEGAMSNTTYVSYAKHGVTVRLKNDLVEGFYVYFRVEEYDGHKLGPSTAKLPADLGVDATMADVEAALGKADDRDVVESMKWVDLEYRRGGALVKVHFAEEKFISVSIELAP